MAKAQIWIETVIYTLIGLAIIALVLSFVKPAIDEKRDQLVLQTSLDMIKLIDSRIEDAAYYGIGNYKLVEVTLKKGILTVDGEEDSIFFEMKSKYKYSEPGENISSGKTIILTNEESKDYSVSFKIDYKNKYNITFNDKDEKKVFNPSSTNYKFSINSLGQEGSLIGINFKEA